MQNKHEDFNIIKVSKQEKLGRHFETYVRAQQRRRSHSNSHNALVQCVMINPHEPCLVKDNFLLSTEDADIFSTTGEPGIEGGSVFTNKKLLRGLFAVWRQVLIHVLSGSLPAF